MAAQISSLCETCQKVDLAGLFRTHQRSPEPDSHNFQQPNSFSNVRSQTSCAFCAILQLITTSSSEPKFANALRGQSSDTIYLEPQMCHFALCGISFSYETDKSVANCLHVQTADRAFHDKIVLGEVSDDTALHKMPLFGRFRMRDSNVNFEKVNGWLNNCAARHVEPYLCATRPPKTNDPEFEKRQRLIEVSTRSVVHKDLTEARYATVSYVWGAEFALQTASQSPAGADGRLAKSLPQTFEDAMLVCASLNIPYLWIDAYCIKQDDPEDKAAQIRHMSSIYQNAFVTIVAIEGLSPYSGLPGVSQPRNHPYYGQPFDCGTCTLAIVPGFVSSTAIPNSRVWSSRAWTLQEALLSRRMLVFNQQYVSFYCGGGVEREDVGHLENSVILLSEPWSPITYHEPSSLSPFTCDYRTGTFEMVKYYDLVRLYSARQMSDPADALNAVSAVLDRWAPTANTTFVAGLPTNLLTDTLMWRGSRYTSRGHAHLPTWCWAAWQGEIVYPFFCYDDGDRAESSDVKHHYSLDFGVDADPLITRRISWSQPGSLNFGNTLELAADVQVCSPAESPAPRLRVCTYIARFPTSQMMTTEYDAWASDLTATKREGLIDPEYGIQGQMIWVRDGPHLFLTTGSGYASFIELPIGCGFDETSSPEVEFLMLKTWYRVGSKLSPPQLDRVWTLLISRDGPTATRLGCVTMRPWQWRLGNPRLDTVILQ